MRMNHVCAEGLTQYLEDDEAAAHAAQPSDEKQQQRANAAAERQAKQVRDQQSTRRQAEEAEGDAGRLSVASTVLQCQLQHCEANRPQCLLQSLSALAANCLSAMLRLGLCCAVLCCDSHFRTLDLMKHAFADTKLNLKHRLSLNMSRALPQWTYTL